MGTLRQGVVHQPVVVGQSLRELCVKLGGQQLCGRRVHQLDELGTCNQQHEEVVHRRVALLECWWKQQRQWAARAMAVVMAVAVAMAMAVATATATEVAVVMAMVVHKETAVAMAVEVATAAVATAAEETAATATAVATAARGKRVAREKRTRAQINIGAEQSGEGMGEGGGRGRTGGTHVLARSCRECGCATSWTAVHHLHGPREANPPP